MRKGSKGRKKKEFGNMRRQFFVVDQGKGKLPRYTIRLVMGYMPAPKGIVSAGYLTKSTADKHAAELNRKGSRGVMKKLCMILDEVWDQIEEERREVDLIRTSNGKSIRVPNKKNGRLTGYTAYWTIPKRLTYGRRKNKHFTWTEDFGNYNRPFPDGIFTGNNSITEWLSKESGLKVDHDDPFGPAKGYTYEWRWNAKWNLLGKALDRLTDYALGKRTQKYGGQERRKDRKALKRYMLGRYLKEIKEELTRDELDFILSKEGQDYLIDQNKPHRMTFSSAYDGVVLFSGGLDSVALGIILSQKKGKKYLPVYISHRANVGNVTKKEITTARKLAKKIFGEELMVIKKDTKSGKLPDWYGKRVYVTDLMPVPKTKKNERNRRFLKVLKEYGLIDKEIWLGVLGIPGAGDRSRAAGRAQDVTKEGLQKHLNKIGGKGKIKVVRDIAGVKTKTDLLKKLPDEFKPVVIQSQSCLMYFNKPCGDCWSCMERVESIMQAYGKDKTPYRQDSKADKFKKQRKSKSLK